MKNFEFDFVVVGGGAAGCVLAARLAQDTDASVALIERGRMDHNPWIHIPATFFKVIQNYFRSPYLTISTLITSSRPEMR